MAIKKKATLSKSSIRKFDKSESNVNQLLDDINTSLYGDTKSDDLENLDKRFQDIMKNEINTLTNGNKGDITSLLSKLYENDKSSNGLSKKIDEAFLNLDMEGTDSTIASFVSDAYRNRVVKQADIHEVSSQLIELREAIDIMRDAIVSPDINTGRINRELKFGNEDSDKDANDNYTSIIEEVEKKFDLQSKIKDFITKRALEYGENYAYIIPYSEIFTKFMKNKNAYTYGKLYDYRESVQDEEIYNNILDKVMITGEDEDVFIENCYQKCVERKMYTEESGKKNDELKKEFSSDLHNILSRISVVNEPIPLPIIEEGLQSVKYFGENFVSEDGMYFEERAKDKGNEYDNVFQEFMGSDGIYSDKSKSSKKNTNFSDIKDCYFKLLTPMELIPITLMDEEIGYFYVQTDDNTPLSGLISTSLYQQKYDENRRERDIIGDIAGRIVDQFDKKFLKENPKFKKLIVEAINYYNLNERNIRFQFIPKEYIFPFKVNKDIDGHGVSMLDGSLFYAKLYLMLLLFKIMTIICNSNDQKVNYIKQSGLDKNLTNKIQDIARQKQARRINMMDLFSYTTMLNKVGNGTELYLPVGRSGDRPIETEILSGQEVSLDTELMQLLRNSYILSSGVPSAIMNYMNEADFAKSIETAQSKFNGRVVNYQLDLNPQITDMYRAILNWSTTIPKEVIDNLEVILPTPKFTNNTVTQDMISNFTATSDFVVNLYFGEDLSEPANANKVKAVRKSLAKKYLPVLNFDELDKLVQDAIKVGTAEDLKPKEKEDNDEDLSI